MKILGIDPGIATTGVGSIEIIRDTPRLIEYSAVKTPKDLGKEKRLCLLHERLCEIIRRVDPDVVAMEMLFFCRNVKTATVVGEARGVALLAVGQHKKEIFEYTPLQVKESLTGYGRTDKRDLREIVQMELDLETPPKPIDASDALAIALCHYYLFKTDEDLL